MSAAIREQPHDEQWRDAAACVDYDSEMWFPLGDTHADDIARTEEAKRICWQLCPVRQRCLDWADGTGTAWGTWGGLTEWERGKPLKRRRDIAACGTDAGYYRHLRSLQEPACQACKTAHSQANAGRT